MNSDDNFDLLNEITDNQATHSDVGGDSGAEDDLIYDTGKRNGEPSTSNTRTRSSDKQQENAESEDDPTDYDSDDSIADPDYFPQNYNNSISSNNNNTVVIQTGICDGDDDNDDHKDIDEDIPVANNSHYDWLKVP